MSDTSTSDPGKPMEQPSHDLSKAMDQLSVTTDDSDKNSTKTKNFSDMPCDVVELIIERSDYKEQLILRKTSKSLRELVDKQKPACTSLKVFGKLDCMFPHDCIICEYNDHCVAYVSPKWDRRDFLLDYGHYRLDTIIRKRDYEQVAFTDLAFTLKNPKLQLETFSFCSDNSSDLEEFDSFDFGDYNEKRFGYKFEDMQNLLQSVNHQLSVKSCGIDISSISNAMSILPYLKPGVLEKIKILSERYRPGSVRGFCAMPQVALLEQWKQAKELEVESGFYKFPVRHATHFKRFRFKERFVKFDDLLSIEDFILEHKNAEFCHISALHPIETNVNSVVGTPVSPNLSHYSTPDSDHYLEFTFFEKSIEIRKIKKS